MGHGWHHLDRDVGLACYLRQAGHLGGHNLWGPDAAVQRHLVNDEPGRRGLVAVQHAALAFHAGGKRDRLQGKGDES
jgi:hypothetical protein